MDHFAIVMFCIFTNVIIQYVNSEHVYNFEMMFQQHINAVRMRTIHVHASKLAVLFGCIGLLTVWLVYSAWTDQISSQHRAATYQRARARRLHNPNESQLTQATRVVVDHVNRSASLPPPLTAAAAAVGTTLVKRVSSYTDGEQQTVSRSVHIFYYPWYGTPALDGRWLHWNHEYLKHWDHKLADQWQQGRHSPPEDVGASFYPQLGPYSSRNRTIVGQHMAWMRQAGCGVIIFSWYPPQMADQQGESWDPLVPMYLDAAAEFDLKLTFHIEPYRDRSVDNLRTNIQYIITRYGTHPAFYLHQSAGRAEPKPMIYVYDSYLIPAAQWKTMLKPGGPLSIRNTPIDCLLMGLVVKAQDKMELVSAGFDGFYTYFGAEGFSWGSSAKNWPSLQVFARKNKLLSSVSVSPGYDDIRVRPWNAINSRGRREGEYYAEHWQAAITANADLISITSFNEWHEGTQIEPAVPYVIEDFVYQDYAPHKADFYLNETQRWVQQFVASKAKQKQLAWTSNSQPIISDPPN